MIIDANVWVSAFIRYDTFHEVCRSWLRAQFARGRLLTVPMLGVAEVAGAVARIDNSTRRGLQIANWLLTSPRVRVISMHDELAGRAIGMAAGYQLRGADAIYVATAEELGLPLVTLDRELHERASSIVRVVRP